MSAGQWIDMKKRRKSKGRTSISVPTTSKQQKIDAFLVKNSNSNENRKRTPFSQQNETNTWKRLRGIMCENKEMANAKADRILNEKSCTAIPIELSDDNDDENKENSNDIVGNEGE